jgi:hypothetical protein
MVVEAPSADLATGLSSQTSSQVTFFGLEFGPGQLTSFMFVLSYKAKYDFINQPSSKSTLPTAR